MTRRMKELGKGRLYILPAAAEKGLRCLHLRAEQRSEHKVFEHLLKQTAKGPIQRSKQIGVRRVTSQEMLGTTLHSGYLLPTQHPLKTTNNIRLQFQWLF